VVLTLVIDGGRSRTGGSEGQIPICHTTSNESSVLSYWVSADVEWMDAGHVDDECVADADCHGDGRSVQSIQRVFSREADVEEWVA
jgi:hypothetical protein